MSICNGSLARLLDSSINHESWGGYPNLMYSYGGLLEPRESKFALLKFTFNAEHFIYRLSSCISSDFVAVHSWNVCVSVKVWKIHQNPDLWGSRSLMLAPSERSLAVLVMINSKCVPIYNRSHARWTNSGVIKIFRGCPSLVPSFEGRLLTTAQNLLTWNERCYAIIWQKPGVSILVQEH